MLPQHKTQIIDSTERIWGNIIEWLDHIDDVYLSLPRCVVKMRHNGHFHTWFLYKNYLYLKVFLMITQRIP